VPPGATADLECELDIVRPGHFETQVHLFLDDVGLREQIITIRGKAVAN
jgi:ATP-dependent Zn protease